MQPTKRKKPNKPSKTKSPQTRTLKKHTLLQHVSLAFPLPRGRARITIINGAYYIPADLLYIHTRTYTKKSQTYDFGRQCMYVYSSMLQIMAEPRISWRTQLMKNIFFFNK